MSWQIRMQADDFFNAYQVLRKSTDAVFHQLDDSCRLKTEQIQGLSTMGPSIVNLAFALELYIKDLHVVLKGQNSNRKKVKAPRGHNILVLFRKLPPEARQEIRNYPSIQELVVFYSVQTPLYIPQDKSKQPIIDTFEQQIHHISDAFEKWRYSYESRVLNYEEVTALVLIEAVKSIADNARRQSAE